MDERSLRNDPKLFYFSRKAAPSSGKHSTADNLVDEYYKGVCVLCGEVGATRAHLISGNSTTVFEGFGPPRYKEGLDVKSVRNFLPLCGTFGEIGTCHNEFDTYGLAILYNAICGEPYHYCFCLNPKFAKRDVVHMKKLELNENHKPYKRVLAIHAKKCYNDFPWFVDNNDIGLLVSAVDLSETVSEREE